MKRIFGFALLRPDLRYEMMTGVYPSVRPYVRLSRAST